MTGKNTLDFTPSNAVPVLSGNAIESDCDTSIGAHVISSGFNKQTQIMEFTTENERHERITCTTEFTATGKVERSVIATRDQEGRLLELTETRFGLDGKNVRSDTMFRPNGTPEKSIEATFVLSVRSQRSTETPFNLSFISQQSTETMFDEEVRPKCTIEITFDPHGKCRRRTVTAMDQTGKHIESTETLFDEHGRVCLSIRNTFDGDNKRSSALSLNGGALAVSPQNKALTFGFGNCLQSVR